MTEGGHRRRTFATAVGVSVGALAYGLTLLNYRWDPERTADPLGYAANFFDAQARAFMDGHLFVPAGSLGIEGFVRNGHEYMYFAPFPALLRIPVLMTTHEFDGRLTLLSMALAFVLMCVMTVKLTWLVRDIVASGTSRPDGIAGAPPLGRYEACAWAAFLALALGGTTLTFNASLPWVYHEVYAWAVPFVVGAMYWMLRVLVRPEPAAIAWLGAFCLGISMTRTTGGWAVCLTTIGIGVWFLVRGADPVRRRSGGGVLAVGVSAFAAGIVYNLVKFGHPYLFPLQDQRWTAVNAHRRYALEANGGTITGPQFFPTSLVTYFRPDGIRFVDYFPWITLPGSPARAVGDVVIDQSYRTGSVTAFMPLLLLLTVVAAVALLMPRRSPPRVLLVPLVAGVLVTGGVMGYGYLAYRYTCEFVPALVVGGAIGLAVVNRWLAGRPRWGRAATLAVVVSGTVFSVAANMLTGFTLAATTAGGEDLARFVSLQQSLSRQGNLPPVEISDHPPSGRGPTDAYAIQGDCDRLYLNTGDRYVPWQLVERRSQVVVATLDRDVQPVITPIATIGTDDPGEVLLQIDYRKQARLLVRNDTGTYPGQWFEVPPPGVIRIGIGDVPSIGYAEVQSTPGGFAGYLRSFQWDDNWYGNAVDIDTTIDNTPRLRASGVRLRTERGLDPPQCRKLLSASETR